MSEELPDRLSVRDLFVEVRRIPDPAQRQQLLDERCGADDGLKSEVFRLLELDGSRGNSLDRFASAVGADPGETAKTLQSIGIAGSLALDSVVGTLGQIGRFELRKLVGRGGMGNVFLAQDMELQRPVALKFPRIERLTSEEERERFFREARLSAKFNHPNLVTVYEVGVLGQMCFIASEWFDGGDFAAWLEKHPGPHNPRWCAELVRPLARAIAYCHDQGVAHLDLKPANIILAMESEQDPMKFRPMLTDFSIARVFEGELSQTNTSMLLGTPLYMAPEQAACDRDSIGPQSDVYALGVVLHELLFGIRPFESDNVVELLDQLRGADSIRLPKPSSVPNDLQTICLRCLAREPDRRYPTANALAEDLDRFLRSEPIRARRDSLWDRFTRWVRHRKRIMDAAAGVIVVQLILTAWVLWCFVLADRAYEGETLWRVRYEGLRVLVVFSLPLFASAWHIAKERRWAIYAALPFAFGGQTLIPLFVLMGKIEMMQDMYSRSPYFEMTNMGLILFSGITQSILLAFALHSSRSRCT